MQIVIFVPLHDLPALVGDVTYSEHNSMECESFHLCEYKQQRA